MTVRSSDELASENLPDNSPTRACDEGAAGGDHPMLNATVTYARLPVWNESHWVGTMVSSAAMLQDRLE